MDLPGARTVIAAIPLRECLNLPGITDGKLFAKNVRQSLGSSNKVNRELSKTIHSDKVRDFFFYHNGITALCDAMQLSSDHKMLTVDGLSVVNGWPLHLRERSSVWVDRNAWAAFGRCV